MQPLGHNLGRCCDCREPVIGWHWNRPRLCQSCHYQRERREVAVQCVLGTLAACLLAFCAFASWVRL